MKMIFSNVPTKPVARYIEKPRVVSRSENLLQPEQEYTYAMQTSMIGRLMNSRTCKSCQK
jgi:hypothetical protein